ncbi:MAG: tRNA pseudouridine(55) synthase TruB, partial [Anaerolineales bacterium]
ITGVRRIGHAGTLDPLATGVLVVCVGAATRLADYLMDGDKRYLATLQLGVETNTWDAEGEVVAEGDTTGLTPERVQGACVAFLGEFAQTPPLYSAIKRDGQPLYRWARRGRAVEVAPRMVSIRSIELVSFALPLVTLDIVCGKGTYIRSLAHDVGAALGCGAHLAALRRLRAGAQDIADAVPLGDLTPDNWRAHLISPWEALAEHPRVTISPEQRAELLLGRAIVLAEAVGERCFAFADDHELVAVLVRDGEPGRWRPVKVWP